MRKTSDLMLVLTKQTDTDYENYTDKMREEIDEFEGALMDYRVHGNISTRDKLIAEAFDVLQVALVILNKVATDTDASLEIAADEHLCKLLKRGWKVEGVVRIRIDK